MGIIIREMTKDDEYYVSTCTHVNENNIEYEKSSHRRLLWLQSMKQQGLKVKVALIDDIHAGFLYIMPIEINPWQIQGNDLMVFPCLVSQSEFSQKGIGKQLIKAAEEETHEQQRKGIATLGYFWDFWFMPAKYLFKLGFKVAARRGEEAILWKKFDKTANPPQFRKENFTFQPSKDKVVVDLFWNTFCLTSDVEAQRVREVALEFGDVVVLNEYSACDPLVLQQYGISRRIFVNGKMIETGPEIEKDKLRQEIKKNFYGRLQ